MRDRRAALLFAAICLACLLTPALYVLRQRARPAPAPAAAPAANARAVAGGETGADQQPTPGPALPSPVAGLSGAARDAGPAARTDGARTPSPEKAWRMLYRHTALGPDYGLLAVSSGPGSVEYRRDLACDRVHYAGGTGVCLTAKRGFFTTYRALVFDDAFRVLHTIELAGAGSRTRVAPNGALAAVTVFVSGHSYADAKFSTSTTLIETRSGARVADLEEFATSRDGAPWKEQDFNFWGVTFAKDSATFYATLASGGRTYLVRGSVGARRMEVVREGVECPSLSPDGAHIAFKKVADAPYRHWVIAVLDLGTMQETGLKENRNVDDQVDWLDDEHIIYGLPESETVSSAVVNTWVIDRRGVDEPRLLLRNAASTVIVR